MLHAALEHISNGIADYACYQIECGAQCVQFFESWAHHIGPSQFSEYAKPYADKAMRKVKERCTPPPPRARTDLESISPAEITRTTLTGAPRVAMWPSDDVGPRTPRRPAAGPALRILLTAARRSFIRPFITPLHHPFITPSSLLHHG